MSNIEDNDPWHVVRVHLLRDCARYSSSRGLMCWRIVRLIARLFPSSDTHRSNPEGLRRRVYSLRRVIRVEQIATLFCDVGKMPKFCVGRRTLSDVGMGHATWSVRRMLEFAQNGACHAEGSVEADLLRWRGIL
jgi:hypothetical protein